MRCAAVAILLALLGPGCAAEDAPERVPIRGGRDPHDAMFLPLDARPRDAAPEAAPPDAAPPSKAADRRVLVVVRDEDPAAAVRARLQPPHAPTPHDAAAALPGVGWLVHWAGPDARTAATLRALVATGARDFAPLYDLTARRAALPGADLPEVAVADVRWLAAHVGDAPRLLRLRGRRAFFVRFGPEERAAWDAARAHLDTLPDPPGWVVESDVTRDGDPPAGVLGVLPGAACGYSTTGRAFEAAADTERIATARANALAAGVVWLPRARPPRNPRLVTPSAEVEPPADGHAFLRSLVLARRSCLPEEAVLVVDGLGAWSDDTQLDPVAGAATSAPDRLTSGLLYAPYGATRLSAVAALGERAGPPAATLASPPVLIELVRGDETVVRRLERTAEHVRLALDAATVTERYELLLDARPFVVPAAASLRYERTSAAAFVDLVFEDGTRLHPGAGPLGVGVVVLPLAPHAGRRVEEVTLVHPGGASSIEVELGRVQVTSEAADGP